MVSDITSLATVEQKGVLLSVGSLFAPCLKFHPYLRALLSLLRITQKASLEAVSTHIQEGLSTQPSFIGAQTTPRGSAFNQLAQFWGLSAVPIPTFMPDLIIRLHMCHSATDMCLAHQTSQSKLRGSTRLHTIAAEACAQ